MSTPNTEPMLPTVAVTGHWSTVDGQPAAGYITVQAVAEAIDGDTIVVAAPVTVTLDDTGAVSHPVVAAPGVQLLVTEHITGAPVTAYAVTPTGTVVDLATAPRGPTTPPVPLYVLASTVGQPGGLATLGTDGRLVPSEYPPNVEGAVTWYAHQQLLPAAVWTVEHGLGHVPAGLFIVDSDGNQIEGDRSDVDDNTTLIDVGNSRAGYAYVS